MTANPKQNISLAAALVLVLSCAANAGPREDVKEIAGLISQHYFDPQRAGEIAGSLERDAAAGSYDRYADRSDLAAQLTQRLKPIDRHFDVSWRAPPSAPVAAATPASPPTSAAEGAAERRANYGFRRVERLPGNLGYLEMTFEANIDFTREAAPAKQAADAALGLLRGADAVILDLRNNGGGAPSMVGYLVSAFVAPKSDVYNTFHSRSGTQSERAEREYTDPMVSVPLYVLISPRTGSAAEAIAFTLQSCGRATVVGENSAGAANPGRPFPTTQGFSVFISTGSPRNPINGRNWEGDGVRPDVAVPTARAQLRAQELALEKLLAGVQDAERLDVQWALEALRANASPFAVKNLAAYAGIYGPLRIEVAGERLMVSRARQPPVALVPLQTDLFHIEGEPARRVAFERDKGVVSGLQLRGSYGDVRKLSRTSDLPASR
jgi:hypothetical protein